MADVHYLGHSCFRLRGRDGIVLCDPYDRSVGRDLGRPTAHIVTVTHNHGDHNNIAAVRPVRDRLFVIDGPGEYEVSDILITGLRTYHDKAKGTERGFNTVYVIHLDDVTFCHLGDLGHELTQHQVEEIGDVDVLFIPVGGGETIGPVEAASVISQLEPRVVIPMHYATPQRSFEQELLPLEKFMHELGLKDKDMVPTEKFSATASNIPSPSEQTRVVVMGANGA